MSLTRHYSSNLNIYIITSVLAGILIGIFTPGLSPYLELPGTLFLRLLGLMIVPIVFFGILGGVVGLENENKLGRLGLQTICYYTLTTALAVATGLAIVHIIEPGKSATLANTVTVIETKEIGLQDVFLNIVPNNIVSAASNGNILGLIFFSIFLGIAILKLKHPAKTNITSFIDYGFKLILFMVDKIMLLAPPGILSLLAYHIGKMSGDKAIFEIASELMVYAFCVIGGLSLHAIVTLPVILLLVKVNPTSYFKALFPAVSTAFSTASSAATLPITLESLSDRALVPKQYANFVAPLGATVNMDGTALYEAIAAIFIANIYGVTLNSSDHFMIFLTATFSAIGAAGVPGAGLIMMTMVLKSAGIPLEGIGIIIGIDRLLDMFRTSVNVWGDSIGAVVLFKLNSK